MLHSTEDMTYEQWQATFPAEDGFYWFNRDNEYIVVQIRRDSIEDRDVWYIGQGLPFIPEDFDIGFEWGPKIEPPA